MNSKETFNSSVGKAGPLESFSWQWLQRLASSSWLQWIDLAWFISILLLLSGSAKLLFLHVLFGILTYGAFHWSLRAFVWKAGIAITVAYGVFGLFPEHSIMQESVLIEISTLTVIIVLFFAVAHQRSATEDLLRQEKRELEKRLSQGTAQLESALYAEQQNKRALLETQELYRKLLEHVAEGIIIHNGTSLLAINPAAVKYLGANNAEEMIGKPLVTWIAADRLKLLQSGGGTRQTYADAEGVTFKIYFQDRPAWMTILCDQRSGKQAELARNAERVTIARDLHDTLGQNLGFLHLKLDQILYFAGERNLSSVRPDLVQMRTVANESYHQVRELISSLRTFNQGQLSKGVRDLAQVFGERAELEIHVVETGDEHVLNSEQQQQVLALCREALTNAIKHAKASHVNVNLSWSPNQLGIEICDDGCGFDLALVQAKGTFGLRGMSERAAQVDGVLTIQSRPNQGTTITLHLPLLPVTP
ncbi:MAG: histidine kinase [Caldilineaceae bacterium]